MAGVRDHLLPRPAVGPARLGGGAGDGRRLQFVWELPGCPADSHELRPDIYVDHRMISTCIRFDSNRAVPYSPTRYPHGTATKSLPPGSATSRSIALNSLFAVRSGLPLSCRSHDRDCSRRSPQRLPRTREFRVAGLTHGLP